MSTNTDLSQELAETIEALCDAQVAHRDACRHEAACRGAVDEIRERAKRIQTALWALEGRDVTDTRLRGEVNTTIAGLVRNQGRD